MSALAEVPQLCPSCAGQLSPGADSCSWCGAGTLAPNEETKFAAPKHSEPTKPNIGFGEGASRVLPSLPPPPRALPFTQLNPTQIFLRAIIVLALVFIVISIGRAVLLTAKATACSNPNISAEDLQMCR